MAVRELMLGAVAGLGGGGGVAEQFTSLAQELRQVAEMNRVTAATLEGNLQARAVGSSSSSSSGGGSVLGTVLKDIGVGLGINPLITGLVKLFGGGSSSAPEPLVRFALPRSVNVEAGVSERAQGVFAVDEGQGRVVRPVTTNVSPQITVQVSAMDSRSFLDRSQDIALAVRQAMLESGVLNDVVREA